MAENKGDRFDDLERMLNEEFDIPREKKVGARPDVSPVHEKTSPERKNGQLSGKGAQQDTTGSESGTELIKLFVPASVKMKLRLLSIVLGKPMGRIAYKCMLDRLEKLCQENNISSVLNEFKKKK